MPVTTNDLIQANNKSIELLESAEELIDSKKGDLPAEDRFVALTTMADIDTRLRVLKFTQAHLTASKVVVEFNAADEGKLTELERQIDDFIIRDAEVNAVLESIPPIMNAVVKIDALINGHIAQA
jgi:hypothetical protein